MPHGGLALKKNLRSVRTLLQEAPKAAPQAAATVGSEETRCHRASPPLRPRATRQASSACRNLKKGPLAVGATASGSHSGPPASKEKGPSGPNARLAVSNVNSRMERLSE